MNRIQRILKIIPVFLVMLLVLSSGSWVADGIKGEILFGGWFGSRVLSVSVVIGVFLAASGLLYRLRPYLCKYPKPVRARVRSPQEPYPARIDAYFRD